MAATAACCPSGSVDVGNPLLAALLASSATGAGAVGHVAWELVTQQLGIGTAVGTAGGLALLVFMRKVSLPSATLYPLRVLASALAIYGAAPAAHGSGFLAVFIAELWPVRAAPAERVFVAWAGLKGAVPILLGALVGQAGLSGARQLYEILFVVTAFSVIVQGSPVPWLARRLRIPQQVTELSQDPKQGPAGAPAGDTFATI